MSHCDDRFGLSELYSTSLGINKIITDWLDMGGQIGVGCFVLLSGYFMVEQNVSVKKILKLAGQVWFYTIGFFGIWLIVSLIQGNIDKRIIKEAVFAFFPITFSEYWFVTAYIILMLLSPYLNKLIRSVDKEEYQKLLACLVILFVILAAGIPLVLKEMIGGRLYAVLIYYFIAGYIRRFTNVTTNNAKRHMLIAILFYLLLLASFYLITFIGVYLNSSSIIAYRYFYRPMGSPIVLIICVELFVAFMQMEIKCSNVINEIASCTFGVYLIQSNRIVRRLVAYCFPIYKETSSVYIFLYSVGAVILIYICCTIIDFIRKNLVEKWWLALLDSHIMPFQICATRKLIQLFSNVKTKLFFYYSGNKNEQ